MPLTRLAPTPSGYLHLGNILSFAITSYYARKYNSPTLLRIDDMDRERARDEYLQDIFDTLEYLGIPWQQGPRNLEDFQQNWSQYKRLELYEKALQQLRDTGQVFACECSRSQIAAQSPDGRYPGTCANKKMSLDDPNLQWRLQTRPARVLQAQKPEGQSVKCTLPASVWNFVVRRKDGLPAYQLTSLIDDLHFGVDIVVRGIDLWPSTWAQLYLAGVLEKHEFLQTKFIHHPLLLLSDGRKLSKSAGDSSIQSLRKEGWSREAIYQHIAKLFGSYRNCENWMELGALATNHFAP